MLNGDTNNYLPLETLGTTLLNPDSGKSSTVLRGIAQHNVCA